MDEIDQAFMETLPAGSTILRAESDPAVGTGRDDLGFYVVDPQTGHRLYNRRNGHGDSRGQFYVRDITGNVIFWGQYRRDRASHPGPPWGVLFYRIQSLFDGPGRRHRLDPDLHPLGKIPTLLLAEIDMRLQLGNRVRSNEVIFVDERRHWSRKGRG